MRNQQEAAAQLDWQRFDLFNPTSEHRLLRRAARQFVAKEIEPGAKKRDELEYFDVALFKKLGALGWLGISVSPLYGGAGMDAVAAVILHEELSFSDPGLCLAFLAHTILCVNNLAVNADEEQKKRFLPKLCSGEWIGCMAMSEPQAGTDVLAMSTAAYRKEEVYVVSGKKMWITNGAVDDKGTPADCVYLYAKTASPQGPSKISTFLVQRGDKGYFVGQRIKGKTGMRASTTAELVFDECQVPASHRIGGEGESLRHMMANLEIERLTLAAMGLGIAKRALDVMNRYAMQRNAFGVKLNQLGQIQRYLAEGYASYRACRSYVYDTARRLGQGEKNNRLDCDGAKLASAQMAKQVADFGMQVLGGYGYVGEFVVERLWRDAKLLEIGGGTLEAHHKNMTSDLAKNPTLVCE